jgi:hypothetical protein
MAAAAAAADRGAMESLPLGRDGRVVGIGSREQLLVETSTALLEVGGADGSISPVYTLWAWDLDAGQWLSRLVLEPSGTAIVSTSWDYASGDAPRLVVWLARALAHSPARSYPSRTPARMRRLHSVGPATDRAHSPRPQGLAATEPPRWTHRTRRHPRCSSASARSTCSAYSRSPSRSRMASAAVKRARAGSGSPLAACIHEVADC